MQAKRFIIPVLILYSFIANAQMISLHGELSKDTALLGEQLVYTFTVKTDESTVAEAPVFYDTISKQIEVLSHLSSDTSIVDDSRVTSSKYLVTSFEQGVNVIHPIAVKFKSGEVSDTAYTLPLSLLVVSPQVDTSLAIMPIKPPINTPVSLTEILSWGAVSYGGFLLITLIIALIWIYLKRKNDSEFFQIKPKEPAHIIALRSLDKLKEDKILNDSNAKPYYTRLTDIIRTYISDLYGIQAMESTSSEIHDEFMQINKEGNELNVMLEELLQLADLVKFAKEDPLRVEKEKDLNKAYEFVKETHQMMIDENELETENTRDSETEKMLMSNE